MKYVYIPTTVINTGSMKFFLFYDTKILFLKLKNNNNRNWSKVFSEKYGVFVNQQENLYVKTCYFKVIEIFVPLNKNKFHSAKLMKGSTMQAYLTKTITFFCFDSVHLKFVLYKNFDLIQHG